MVEERPEGPLRVRRAGRVVVATMDAPPMNPVSREMVEAWEETLAAVAADDGVRALVVTGAGSHFCVGADIKQFRDIGVVETEDGYFRRRSAMVTAISRYFCWPVRSYAWIQFSAHQPASSMARLVKLP